MWLYTDRQCRKWVLGELSSYFYTHRLRSSGICRKGQRGRTYRFGWDLRVKVTKFDGTALTDTDYVVPSNFLLKLCSQIDLSLNGNLTTPSQNTYTWRWYLESLLSYRPDALDSQLGLSGFSLDTPSELDSMDKNYYYYYYYFYQQ